MPDGKNGTTWYPFGRPEWWKEFGRREARGWQDIGRRLGEVVDIFNPLTPLPPFRVPSGQPSPYAAPRYPMPTYEPQKPGGIPLPGWAKSRIPPSIGTPELEAIQFPVTTQDKEGIWGGISTLAQALGITQADLDEIAMESGYLSLADMPTADVAKVYADLRNRATRLTLGSMASEEARQRLQRAVNVGAVSPEAAYGISPEKRMELISSEEAIGPVPRTAWEQWQRGEATKGMIGMAAQNQERVSQFINSVMNPGIAAMRRATTTEEIDQLYQQLLTAFAPYEGLTSQMGSFYGETLLSLAFAERTAKEAIWERQGQLLRTEYQPWYAKFMAGRSSFTKGTDMGQQFRYWAETSPEFQQAKLAKETEMYKEWPELYGAYKAAPVYERTQAGGFMPWVQSKPETKAWYEQERAIRERPKPFRTPTYRMPRR